MVGKYSGLDKTQERGEENAGSEAASCRKWRKSSEQRKWHAEYEGVEQKVDTSTGYPEATKHSMEKLLLLELSNKRPVEFAGQS